MLMLMRMLKCMLASYRGVNCVELCYYPALGAQDMLVRTSEILEVKHYI